MRIIMKAKMVGVTLVEILLVLVIISMIILMSVGYLQQRTLTMRMDRTALQMQQILNASLSYYVANNAWPPSLDCLQGKAAMGPTCTVKYLPFNMQKTPWNSVYTVVSTTSNVYVYTNIQTVSSRSATTIANTIAGSLPLGYATAKAAPSPTAPPPDDSSCSLKTALNACYVVGSVNIPAQNLNNATAVNYAGLYHSGACVPVPTCPVDGNGNTMTPQIIVVPVSVTGAADQPTDSGGTCDPANLQNCSISAYPINSFTASSTPAAANPVDCQTRSSPSTCADSYASGGTLPAGKNYWRVCLEVATPKGQVTPTGAKAWPWGMLQGTVLAITRCGINKEGANSSDFTIWAP